MRKAMLGAAVIILFAFLLAGCSLFGTGSDIIDGKWQQFSVGGSLTAVVTVLQFSDSSYSSSIGFIPYASGTWTKSGDTYLLTGSIFGTIVSNWSLTPSFSNNNKTMTYTDSGNQVEIYHKQ